MVGFMNISLCVISPTVRCEISHRLDGSTGRLVELFHGCYVCVIVPEIARDNAPDRVPPGWCVADILVMVQFGVSVRRTNENLLEVCRVEASHDCVNKGLP